MPQSIKVQGGKGKLINDADDKNRRDYTQEELVDVQNKLSFIHNSYVIWLRSIGFTAELDE
jgi:hypothetical protein